MSENLKATKLIAEKIAGFIVLAILLWFVAGLVLSFVIWEPAFNPTAWGHWARGGFASLWLLLCYWSIN